MCAYVHLSVACSRVQMGGLEGGLKDREITQFLFHYGPIQHWGDR